jgi:hypothetical protein
MSLFDEVEVGDTVYVQTAWGGGPVVTGVVVGKEKGFMGDRNVIDYMVDGKQFDSWAYDYQIKKVIKEKV